MSTVLPLMVASFALSGWMAPAHKPVAQGTIGPCKLYGASQVIYDNGSAKFALGLKSTPYTYTYTVELNAISSSDTVVYISDTTHCLHHPASVVVPAYTLQKSFLVWATGAPSTGTMTASNANSFVPMDIETVLP